MTIQRELGEKGEQLATEFLKNAGYHILAKNWRYRRAEIDIIAKDHDVLVCIEVKTRSYDHFGAPDRAVNRKKERLLAEAMQAYMVQINHQWEVRFDIITITWHASGESSVRHIKDAFFPGLGI